MFHFSGLALAHIPNKCNDCKFHHSDCLNPCHSVSLSCVIALIYTHIHCYSLVATFASFSHTTKVDSMWSPITPSGMHKPLFISGWSQHYWDAELSLCFRSDTNKRLMKLLVTMDHGCPDTVWCSWRMLNLSGSLCFLRPFVHCLTHSHLPSEALAQCLLISFHTHFLTKKGKVRGWREGEEAFAQFITGHPSLCCFCPRLTLYVVPCQPEAPCPVKLISLFRILGNTHKLTSLGTGFLVHRQPM